MESSVLRNEVAATSRERAALRKMKVRDPWGLRSLQTTHKRESLPGLEGAKADSRLCHSCRNLPASSPLLLPLLRPPLPLKSTSKNLLQLRERPAEWRGRGSVCGRGLDFEWEIENPLFGDKIHMPYNSPI